MKIAPLSVALLVATASAFWVGCASDASEDTPKTGDDQNATSRPPGAGNPAAPAACQVVAVKDGHTLSADELKKLDDPIANFILKGEGCPLTFSEIQDKVAKVDPCGKDEEGLTTRFVTDRAQLLETPDSYRAVVKRQCQQRTESELFMSIFGIGTTVDAKGKVKDVRVPQTSVELIGEQRSIVDGKTNGIFNFYAREDNQWKFFGSSTEFLSQGYDCNADGACVPKAATKQRCASCHVGGGLVMKELESPWVNWEGDVETPGTNDLITKAPKLWGTKGDGIDLEGSVERGNQNDWIPARVRFAKTLGLKEVLRPLFCTIDMNLSSVGGRDDQFISNDLFVDRIFRASLSDGSVTKANYEKAIAAAGQKVIDGRTGSQLIGKDKKPVAETVMGFTFPMKSRQDSDYIQELMNQQIVDIDFVKDVLAIDMTRPVYSATRCALLESTPNLPADQMTFEKVKAAFVTSLASVSSPSAAQLLTHLKEQGDAGDHDLAARNFLAACDVRFKSDAENLLKDVLSYASHLRRAVKRVKNPTNGGIIEFAETLPVDDLPETKAAFDPITCKLQ